MLKTNLTNMQPTGQTHALMAAYSTLEQIKEVASSELTFKAET